MNKTYVAEMLRATGSLRPANSADVAAVIRDALSAAGLNAPGEKRSPGARKPAFGSPSGRTRGAERQPEPSAPMSGRMRRPLAEVVQTLRAGGNTPGLRRPAQSPEPAIPAGAKFLERRYSTTAGARRYRLYVPATAGDGLGGLIVMLHGCRQTPEDFAIGTGMNALAEAHRLLVAYPAQDGGDNAMSCWNWFRPEDQARAAGEPTIIAELTISIRDEFRIAGGQVFVAGLSAGGAMAAIMAEAYPELYAAVGVHSGLAYGAANDVLSAFAAMRGDGGNQRRRDRYGPTSHDGPRLIVFHGDADATVHPSNAAQLVTRHGATAGASTRSERIRGESGRGYTRMIVERASGINELECWMIDGAPHAWAGGQVGGSYTDPRGPDASAAMVRFFLHGASDARK